MIEKDVWLLATGQALTSTVTALLVSISSLAGASLAPSPLVNTLPVTATTFGTLLMIYFASSLMATYGRRTGFLIKATLGMLGSLIAFGALIIHSFVLFVAGTFVIGLFIAFGQYYRFAAMEVANLTHGSPAHSLSLVTGAGVVGGILGPWLASHSASEFSSAPYAGAFGVIFVLCVSLLVSQQCLSPQLGRISAKYSAQPEEKAESQTSSTGMQQSTNAVPHRNRTLDISFWMITLAGAASGGAMTLIMTATPLAMQSQHITLGTISLAMQIHFALMYLPSFIFPMLTHRLRIKGCIGLGILFGFTGGVLPLCFSTSSHIQIIELGLAGAGWSLISNGSTLLLSRKAGGDVSFWQGINTTAIYLAGLITSLLAGVLLGAGVIAAICISAILIWCMALPSLWLPEKTGNQRSKTTCSLAKSSPSKEG